MNPVQRALQAGMSKEDLFRQAQRAIQNGKDPAIVKEWLKGGNIDYDRMLRQMGPELSM